MDKNLVEHLKEVHAWYNMLNHLKERFNYGKSLGVSIGDALTNQRVATALHGRVQEFLSKNFSYTTKVRRLQGGAQDLTIILSEIGDEFSEEEQSNLSYSDRTIINESLEMIEDGILRLAGYLLFMFENNKIEDQIPSDLSHFSVEVKEKFEKIAIADAAKQELEDIAEKTERDVEEVEEEAELKSAYLLNSSKKENDGKVKKVISTDIDGI